MYAVSGFISIIWQLLLTVGIFLLTVLGKLILLVSVSCYEFLNPRNEMEFEEPPFQTMYPESIDFEDIYCTLSTKSQETLLINNQESKNCFQFNEEFPLQENNYSNLIQSTRGRKNAKTFSKLKKNCVQTVDVSVNTDCYSKTCLKTK